MIFDVRLRPDQEEILTYQHGQMGIMAVPGSGKTYTLSLLAAQIIARGILEDDQEVLVVTLVNSAVDNFYQRVSSFISKTRLLPNLGYRVRTLHGLAHDIVRERPELAGLDNNFTIIDDREADLILEAAVQALLRSNPDVLTRYIKADLETSSLEKLQRDGLPSVVKEIAASFIRFAKDLRIPPEHIVSRLDQIPIPLPLAELGQIIYSDYQRALAYRGSVDFDDLIQYALTVLKSDEKLLMRLQYRWPFILEDEAQDSSRLQEEILSTLVGSSSNWVRVGDPNQAIYETFTTANPRFLRDFIHRKNVRSAQLTYSGRSTKSIISLANYLVEWSQADHPLPEVRDALQRPPIIQMTPPGDPQPNPPDDPQNIWLGDKKYTPAEETKVIASSIERWLPEHQDETIAVLAPRNQRAFDLADELRRRGIPYIDNLLRSSSTTRFSAGALANILRYLADPQSASKLATVYRVFHRLDQDEAGKEWIDETVEMIRKCKFVENFIWPVPGKDWLEGLDLVSSTPHIYEDLSRFRTLVRKWQSAIVLPVDQIVLTLAQDLLYEPVELAIAHKLAVLLRNASFHHPAWKIPELTEELAVIARNERRFLGFAEDETGFDPEHYKGKVVISTIHKAKGLEWDRVYLMSVNNYDFPSGMSEDSYIAEKWFIRDSLNLPAEAMSQLENVLSLDEFAWYQEGDATRTARMDYIRERMRLLYVGITRAKKNLIVTWNTGRRGESFPATGLVALQEYWHHTQHK
jgi:DNA helicase II / ATP-dependent DNA helicase PcrA